MTAHRSSAALTAAAFTAAVLLARWWASSRHRADRAAHRHDPGIPGGDRAGEAGAALPDAVSDHALREAEELLSRQWNRLRSLYPGHPDDTAQR